MKRNISNNESKGESTINMIPCESINNSKTLNQTMAKDLKIYGTVIQSFIVIAFLGLITVNFFNVNSYCQKLLESNSFRCNCVLEKCHYYLMGISLSIINVITVLLMTYDYYQFKKEGYRLNDYFLYFLAWSGGWIPIICMFTFTGYKLSRTTSENQKMIKLFILFSVISVTSVCFYVILKL